MSKCEFNVENNRMCGYVTIETALAWTQKVATAALLGELDAESAAKWTRCSRDVEAAQLFVAEMEKRNPDQLDMSEITADAVHNHAIMTAVTWYGDKIAHDAEVCNSVLESMGARPVGGAPDVESIMKMLLEFAPRPNAKA